MADAKAVMERVQDWRTRSNHNAAASSSAKQNVTFSCLVPNAKGFHGAFEAGTDEVAIFGSASEAFSQKNINCSIKESIDRFRQVADLATAHNIPLRGYVSCVLGCPYQGHVSPCDVARVSEQLLELGCHEISLGDTIGVGTPLATVMMLEQVKAVVEKDNIAVHMHDTFGQALANIHAALLEGISTIDSSVAGLGGCPYADGASGNVASEDVVYMLHGMGIETGIDLDRLIDAGNFISGVLGRETRSKVASTPLATVMMLEQVKVRCSLYSFKQKMSRFPYTYISLRIIRTFSSPLKRFAPFGIDLLGLYFGQAVVEKDNIAVHMHDTFGQALANIHAALLEGISTIDSSVAGLGGCPYADGASGNVASEDVVYMLHGMGIETGIDLDRLIDAGNFISGVLGRETRSKVASAMKKSSP
eukprot:CAMPEP_0198303442 /NCGR_PEP_ID=MMETSP1449-20131203/56888_1 /TAXON_ID=420275 /ORGANISM="Attheya septentrionalis, Strain CCMP2084" /LENGTH=418 /DNA_ID=CAMNT_0044005935 /DNA_START=408 /DNA_END=1664 /DNA_ORIENTATION=+